MRELKGDSLKPHNHKVKEWLSKWISANEFAVLSSSISCNPDDNNDCNASNRIKIMNKL